MIKSIEIKNFKSIKKKYFPLKNLNLLFGKNGMGKSSLIQLLLAIKQSNLNNDGLRLNGYLINLGNTKDVLYQYSKNENLAFELKFSNNSGFNLEFEYKPEADYFKLINEIGLILYEQKAIEQDFFIETLFTDNFQYLNANRVEPKSIHPRNYSSVVSRKNIGNNGEFTAHFIQVYGSENIISFDNLLHPKSWVKDKVTGEEMINKTLVNQINLWMGEISPNINIKTTTISNDYVLLEYEFKQKNFGFTNRFKPENVGFGISYCLPVVVALLTAKENELIIIENPESHIHPRGQAELGKLIALVAQNNVQVIIETHSDHILNGIRVAIKEKNIDKDKAIAFYFDKEFEASEQYSRITNIEFDRNGELSDYPNGMLDEWSNQLLKLI